MGLLHANPRLITCQHFSNIKDAIPEWEDDEVDVETVVDAEAVVVGTLTLEATKGVAETYVMLIQEVAAKKLASWNCAALLAVSCVAKEARADVLDPGPVFPYSPNTTASVCGDDLLH